MKDAKSPATPATVAPQELHFLAAFSGVFITGADGFLVFSPKAPLKALTVSPRTSAITSSPGIAIWEGVASSKF